MPAGPEKEKEPPVEIADHGEQKAAENYGKQDSPSSGTDGRSEYPTVRKEKAVNKEHYNELIALSQEIFNDINSKLIDYLNKTYGSVPENTMAQQMEDYIFVAEESMGYVLGNALALVDPDSLELEISTFENQLRRIVEVARKKAGSDIPPS
jgi:hypothetical protein